MCPLLGQLVVEHLLPLLYMGKREALSILRLVDWCERSTSKAQGYVQFYFSGELLLSMAVLQVEISRHEESKGEKAENDADEKGFGGGEDIAHNLLRGI